MEIEDRIVLPAEYRKRAGNISRSTEHRDRKAGRTPTPITKNGRVIGYRESSFQKWLDELEAVAKTVLRANGGPSA